MTPKWHQNDTVQIDVIANPLHPFVCWMVLTTQLTWLNWLIDKLVEFVQLTAAAAAAAAASYGPLSRLLLSWLSTGFLC